MKRMILSVICLCMTITLFGCGNNTDTDTDSATTNTTSSSDITTSDSADTISDSADTISDSVEIETNEATDIGSQSEFSFTSEDIYGNEISSSVYSDYKLTLINVFATWCPPCIAELPELASVYNEMESKGVNAMGFVVDTRTFEGGEIDDEAMTSAKILYESYEVKYPMIIPDETFLNGYLITEAVPTTYFVDSNGNMVGEPVVGANDYEGWKAIIEERLEML